MSALPAVCDYLAAAFAAQLGPGRVFDGPPTQYIGSSGVALGATREDESVIWDAPTSDMTGSGEAFTLRCLAWSGSGDVTFKPHRDAVAVFLVAAEEVVAADRTLGGAASTAWITGGTWMQEQTGSGALVTCEFRIDCTTY